MEPYDPNDESLDSLDGPIADYFSRRLDPQRGRALAALRNAACAPAPRPSRWRRSRRLLVAAAALAAAGVLAMLGPRRRPDDAARGVVDSSPYFANAEARQGEHSPSAREPTAREPTGEVHVEQVAVIADTPRVVEELIRFRTIDEGIVVIDGRRPVRKLRRQWLERVAWFDESTGARIERTMPREELVYVDVPMN